MILIARNENDGNKIENEIILCGKLLKQADASGKIGNELQH